jgi:hypothetical protein
VHEETGLDVVLDENVGIYSDPKHVYEVEFYAPSDTERTHMAFAARNDTQKVDQ